MKTFKRISAALCTAALLMTTVFAGTAGAASAETTKFLDPFDNSTFPKAYKTNVTLPKDYDRTYAEVMQLGGVFGPNGDKKALAALMNKKAVPLFKEVLGSSYLTSRKSTLMKNFVRCKLELIYKFDNGFSDFEFMGLCGATGNWAGAWGKSDTVEFSYAASETGNWTKLNYDKIRNMPAGQDSTYCTFASKVPTTARFLKITFLDSSKYNSTKKEWETQYENWACVLGYLLVNQYKTPQGGSTTASKPGSTSSSVQSSQSAGNSASSSVSSSGSAQNQNSSVSSDTQNVETSSEITGSENSSVTGTQSDSPDGNLSDNSSVNNENADNKTDESNPEYETEVTREIDWKITGIIIAADVLVMAALSAVLILLYRKKLNQLGK